MFPYFIGASIAAITLAFIFGREVHIYSAREWAVFVWLGAVASGLGFFMWNRGALIVNRQTLAVANNLKLPIAIVVSLTVFGETANTMTLLTGVIILTLALRVAALRPETK